MMFRILATVLCLLLLECTFYCSSYEYGESDENCYRSKCECCVNNHCGRGTWFQDECKSGCIDGHRGARCYELCTSGCKSCPDSADECTSCYDGFFLDQTDCKKCPPNCKTCSSSTYCTACKEGFLQSVSSQTCDDSICPANCDCNQGNCISCKNGYYDTTESCNRICPFTCENCVSAEECVECKNGYYNGYGLYGDTDILLNNCTHKCRNTCFNCSSGDECLQCPNGKHGLQCEEECSARCKDNICLIKTGQCDCSSNFSGEKCTECIVGKSGETCEQDCPVSCKDGICDKLSRYCINGCITYNFTGDECNKCVTGVYGELCDKPCPENCKSRQCEKVSGLCADGCNDNFNGSTCEICIKSKYGAKCKLDCPFTCANNVCERQTGRCFHCIANFDGEMCDQCIPGLYGAACDKKCSPHCYNVTCGKDEGICNNGCEDKYSGDKCCLNNEKCKHCLSNTECRECKSGFFQSLCDDKCPLHCHGPCDFSTGICPACLQNRFGLFCNKTCPENCKASDKSYTSRCLSIDGRCVFGCREGFFGLTCNKTCSSLCKDGVCMQETGICINGCTGRTDDPACILSTDRSRGMSTDKPTTALTAVFASLFALSTFALCIILMWKMVKKVHLTCRQTKEPTFHIHFENSLAERQQKSQNEDEIAVSDDENVAYEIIDGTEDNEIAVSEDENVTYEIIDGTADGTENDGNIKYMNLSI